MCDRKGVFISFEAFRLEVFTEVRRVSLGVVEKTCTVDLLFVGPARVETVTPSSRVESEEVRMPIRCWVENDVSSYRWLVLDRIVFRIHELFSSFQLDKVVHC